MIIMSIDSSNVSAYRIKIYADDILVFNGCMPSNPDNTIHLENIVFSQLRIEYNFLLSSEDKELLYRDDIGYDNLHAYAYIHRNEKQYRNYENFVVNDVYCPVALQGMYASVINNIPADMEKIQFIFKRSVINKSLPILTIVENKDTSDIEIFYERVDCWAELLAEVRKKRKKYFFLKFLAPLIIFSVIGLWLAANYPQRRMFLWLFRVGIIVIVYGYFESVGKVRKFMKRAEVLHRFKEEKETIEEL